MTEPAIPVTPKRRGRPRKTPETPGTKRERPKQKPKTLRSVSAKASPEARKIGAAILEVFGGARTPSAAAEALGCTANRYYQLEARAFQGFLAGCERGHPGREKSPRLEIDELKRKNQRLERESARLQALVRVLQRSCSLPPAPSPKKSTSGKKRPRHPKSRALVAAAVLAESPANDLVTPAPPATEQS
jgi:hypothetical protein